MGIINELHQTISSAYLLFNPYQASHKIVKQEILCKNTGDHSL
jgi:hypothetical protein